MLRAGESIDLAVRSNLSGLRSGDKHGKTRGLASPVECICWKLNAQNELLETCSGQVLGLRPEILKMSFLRPILARFWYDARNAQNKPPEACSGQVLGLRPEMLKMSLPRPVLARFWARGEKYSK